MVFPVCKVLAVNLASQEVLGLVAAGSNVDGESRHWEAGKGDSALDHLEINFGSHWEGLKDGSIKVDGDRGALLGHHRVGVDAQFPGVDKAVVLEAWASIKVGLGHCHGHQGKNQSEGFHLLVDISTSGSKDTCQSVPM